MNTHRGRERIDELLRLRGLAFILVFGRDFSYEPAIDFVVRVLEWAGHHCAYLDRDVADQDVGRANRAVAEAVEALRASGEPYILVTHVFGNNDVDTQCGGGMTLDDGMAQIRNQLIKDIEMLG